MSGKPTELLPCPFCGSAMTLQGTYTSEHGWNFFSHEDRMDSDCILAEHEIGTRGDYTTPNPRDADKWNRRAAAASSIGENDAIR